MHRLIERQPCHLARHRQRLRFRPAPRQIGATLHDLRHFYASGLIAAGCDVVTVQRALGHAKATTTLNTYAHPWPSAEDRTRQAAGQLFTAAFGNFCDGPATAQGVSRPF